MKFLNLSLLLISVLVSSNVFSGQFDDAEISIFSTTADGSHFDKLEDKFLNSTNGSITPEQIEGVYLGSCFTKWESLGGVLLATRKFIDTSTVDADSGPLFPAVTTTRTIWKTSQVVLNNSWGLNVTSRTSDDDEAISKLVDEFWSEHGDNVLPIKMINGSILAEAQGSYRATDYSVETTIKNGTDGFMYSKTTSSVKNSAFFYCYYFKKLF